MNGTESQSKGNRRPKITEDEAVLLVERLYGVKVLSVREMISYDDRNFLFIFSETNGSTEVMIGSKYTMKILNFEDSRTKHVGMYS